jgi:hypothetical protein
VTGHFTQTVKTSYSIWNSGERTMPWNATARGFGHRCFRSEEEAFEALKEYFKA